MEPLCAKVSAGTLKFGSINEDNEDNADDVP